MKSKLLILFVLIFSQAYSQFMMPMTGKIDFYAKPALLWKYKTNGPIVGSPVINNETVFVGSLDSSLYALDITTGKLKWKLPTGGAIRSSVAILDQKLFLLSSDGILYLVEKDSGKVGGFFPTMTGYIGDRQHDFADYYTSSPVLQDSIIYFGSGDYIYALSINDGYLRWTYKTGDLVHTTPAISNGKLYAGSFDGHLYAIDIKTGNLVWKFKTTGKFSFPKGEVTGNPVVAGGMVFAGARDYNLYAVDLRGGYTNWMKQFQNGWSLPVTHNDSVIYVGTSDDRTIFALDIRTGNEVWKTPCGFNMLGGCAIATNIGYFCTLSGKILGIDLKTGNAIWAIELDSFTENHLKWLKPDESYRDDIGQLILNPLDMLVMYGELGGIFGTPALDGDRLVVAGYDGWVYCYSGSAQPKK